MQLTDIRFGLDSSGLGFGSVTGPCECGYESSVAIKMGECFDWMSDC